MMAPSYLEVGASGKPGAVQSIAWGNCGREIVVLIRQRDEPTALDQVCSLNLELTPKPSCSIGHLRLHETPILSVNYTGSGPFCFSPRHGRTL